MQILMVAAENGAIPGGKVGGIGDVIRDIPIALAKRGHHVHVMTPGYERLSKVFKANFALTLTVRFCGTLEQVALYRRDIHHGEGMVTHWIVENPLFAAGGEGVIYCEDQNGPFATDAHKFALLSMVVSHALLTEALPVPDVIHLHDWHAALVLFISRFLPAYKSLQRIPTVYSIHNLSIQGIRPFGNNGSSPESWFTTSEFVREDICDPNARECINLMRTGINLAGKVHVVSPNYAREIVHPSRPENGFVGGEGLETDLQVAQRNRRLVGILNGIDYEGHVPRVVTKDEFIVVALECLQKWVGNHEQISRSYFYAQQRLALWQSRKRDALVIASIGRLVWQKVGLLGYELEEDVTALDEMLAAHPDAWIVMIGSGDPWYEQLMTSVMARHENFIFLQGYSEALAALLYDFCDAFLMPSTYEPCGISQLIALRAGKPCLVHDVGGLTDTVRDGVSGITFTAETVPDKVQAMKLAYDHLIDIRENDPRLWTTMQEAAAGSRFDWNSSIDAYLNQLYPRIY